jgi:sugar (pentulose or hexulose) kinase
MHEQAYRRTAMFADVNAYLTWQLSGHFQTSWASADPWGLFDMQEKLWSAEILKTLQLQTEQLPLAMAPGSVMGFVSEKAAALTTLPAGTPVIAGGGDGQAAGLSVNAVTSGRAYLNLGTAVVAGVHSTEYRVGRAWRTMGSCTGHGYYLETSLRSGTFLLDWFLDFCGGGTNRREVRARLESEAASLPVGNGGVLAVPYWGAVMTPYWDPNARGCLLGLTCAHGAAHIYRALLEGIALEQATVTAMIEEDAGIQVKEFVAIGGGAESDLWCQIVADACGKAVKRSSTVEASSLGAAMCAAAGADWFDGVPAAAEAMSAGIECVTEPCENCVLRYRELLEIYREISPQLRQCYRKLAGFVARE